MSCKCKVTVGLRKSNSNFDNFIKNEVEILYKIFSLKIKAYNSFYIFI